MNTHLRAGFAYRVEIINKRTGETEVIDAHNLVPIEGLNHILNTEFKSGTPVGTWYIGLFEGNYTPTTLDTAATFPGAATECTAYAAATRVAWVPGSVSAGVLDNSASKAEFAMNAVKTIYGAFVASASAKGATTGTLISAVRFPSPRALDSDSVLKVTAGFTLASA